MQTPRNPLDIIYGRKKKTRKAFKTSTKKMEWMSSAGKDALDWRTNFAKKSREEANKVRDIINQYRI